MRALKLASDTLKGGRATEGERQDLTAFIALALAAVNDTVDRTVEPWEKRGYWLKADRFRRDWSWAKASAGELHQALMGDDWPRAARIVDQLESRLDKVELPKRHGLGRPWAGAWSQWQREKRA